jgi:hypothetical protein
VCKEGEEKCNIYRGVDSKKEDKEEIEKEIEEEIEEEGEEEDKGGSSNKEDTDIVKAEQEEAQQVFKQQ